LPAGRASANALRLRYKQNAKRDGRVFGLTKEEFVHITSSDCYYCGVEPLNVYGGKTYNGDYTYNGIDRVDNRKGYITSNVVPCCRNCNSKKQHLTIEELRNFADKMEAYARDYSVEN
jgi:5-methylcytosine-specific restriction endonuclease McrA